MKELDEEGNPVVKPDGATDSYEVDIVSPRSRAGFSMGESENTKRLNSGIGQDQVDTWTEQELEEEKTHPLVRICMQLNESPTFDNLMLTCIILNSVFMAMPYHGMPDTYEKATSQPSQQHRPRRGTALTWCVLPLWQVLQYAETSFTIIFVVEFLIKFIAMGGTLPGDRPCCPS